MTDVPTSILYGLPPIDLWPRERGVTQTSPLIPGSEALEAVAEATLDQAAMLAPPGVLERRYAMALALKALKPGAEFTVMAPKDRGGSRLKKELEAFGCEVVEGSKRHHRICTVEKTAALTGLDAAIAEGAARQIGGFMTQPGVFSWDRVDPGTQLLLQALPGMSGAGADLGCGIGLISLAVLAAPKVEALQLIDLDSRAVDAARANVTDPRATIAWADATLPGPVDVDFVVMNPPFHDAGIESKNLGQRFIQAAHDALRKGGVLWMVANRHLPYEPILKPMFRTLESRADAGGYKVFEARK
jgi:16S rRNA (guanine1207-N2)-methyltransferase